MQHRVYPFESIRNFRDFGAYPTQSGAKVRSGLLFRSAHFAQTSPHDRQALDALGVRFVLDLRRPDERAVDPNLWPGEGVETLSNDDGAREEAPHMSFVRQGDLSLPAVDDYMHSVYRRLPFEARHLALFASYFDALLGHQGPGVVHCAAGKDRTGLICAFTLMALGVARDIAIADYELTNAAANVAERAPGVAKSIERQLGRPVPIDGVALFIGVHGRYLETAFDEIEREFGALEHYLEHALRLTPEKRAALQRLCLEPA